MYLHQNHLTRFVENQKLKLSHNQQIFVSTVSHKLRMFHAIRTLECNHMKKRIMTSDRLIVIHNGAH